MWPYHTVQLTSRKRMNVSDVELPTCSILLSLSSYLKSFIYDHADAELSVIYARHGVIAISNHNRLQSITGFLVIIIAILVSKCHVITIAIEYIAKVIAISDYFMITASGKHRI